MPEPDKPTKPSEPDTKPPPDRSEEMDRAYERVERAHKRAVTPQD